MSDNQINKSQPQPTESEPQAPSVTVEIEKQPKGTKTTNPKAYLDDHVNQYGQNLISSIATLINQSKEADKPKKKKKKMTPEMLEQCRRNLAKGRETIRNKKQQHTEAPTPLPTPTLTPTVEQTKLKAESKPIPTPTPKPAPKPAPAPTMRQLEPESEQLTIRLSDLLF